MQRSSFIKNCGFACLGGVLLATLVDSCAASNAYVQAISSGDRELMIKKSDFIDPLSTKNEWRKYVLLKSPRHDFPVCVFRIEENTYTALLMKCTHNGCELQPQGSFLVCPCHGSEFSDHGDVLNPPADENLQTFKTHTDGENIYITL